MKKTVIVTGAGRGIGLATAVQLAKDGFNIVMTSRSPEERYADAVQKIRSLGAQVLYIKADSADTATGEAVVSAAVKRFGRIDALVNNAGVAPKVRNDLLEMTEESFDYVVGTNTKGTLFMTQAAARQMVRQDYYDDEHMRDRNKGAIVNISSCSAEVSSISRGEYCISKAGISMITTLFADRLADEGITVNEVRPGIILTDMTGPVKEKYDRMIGEGVFPIRRWGRPEDVAMAVSMFLSDKLRYTTGSYLDVDGGFHIKRL
ncbi:MAG: 3-ketoacyl-ACP reductase [Christensenellaceae bacterium]|nr:3-ketoacyl-ACP reductase [Christensenellaceae bacterium]